MRNRFVKKYRPRVDGYASMPNTPVREDLEINSHLETSIDVNAVTQKLQTLSLKRKRQDESDEVVEPSPKKHRAARILQIGGVRPVEVTATSQSFLMPGSFFTKPTQKFIFSPGVASSADDRSMDLDEKPQSVFVFGKKI